MRWEGRAVLVTGAGGFIGSRLTERLVALGATVRVLCRYNSMGSLGWLCDVGADTVKALDIKPGDIRDARFVEETCKGIDTVFHLAALIAIPYSYRAPESFVDTNVRGTLNVLEGARRARCRMVVHTSTSEVYGTARYTPIDEGHPLQAQSPYAATKIAADKLVESYHRTFSVPAVTVRPFNTFGPRQSARAIVPTIITQALGGGPVRLGNLTPSRDLSYVDNTVDGFIAAASTPEAVGRVFNLGSETEISVGDLAKLIGNLVGVSLNLEVDDERVRPPSSEVEQLLASAQLARTVLGWEPTVDLQEGLRRTIDWVRQHRDRYRPEVYAI